MSRFKPELEIDYPLAETACERLMRCLEQARSVGKEWWVALQIAQIEGSIFQQKKIDALVEAISVIRDAQNDCVKDGLPGAMPVPDIVMSKLDKALEYAALEKDPAGSFMDYIKHGRIGE